jgi:hypothetical protein
MLYHFCHLPNNVVVDFCLSISGADGKPNTFKMIIYSPDSVDSSYSFLPNPGEPCFLIDVDQKVVKAVVILLLM